MLRRAWVKHEDKKTKDMRRRVVENAEDSIQKGGSEMHGDNPHAIMILRMDPLEIIHRVLSISVVAPSRKGVLSGPVTRSDISLVVNIL